MDKIIDKDEYGRFTVTSDDDYLASVLTDLCKNNTAFPEIVDLYEFGKMCKVKKTDENGEEHTEKVKRQCLRVYFADDTWTDVIKSDQDENDRVVAILYAIVKRLMGTPTEGGYVVGDGFMSKLKKYAGLIRSEETENRKKEERIKAKEEEDRKAHEAAVRRREAHPSLGKRLANLEEKFTALCDFLKK